MSAKAATASTTATTPAASTSSLDLGNGISLDRIRIVIRKLKLEGTTTSSGTGMLVTVSRPATSHDDNGGSGSSGSGSSSGDGSSSSASSSSGDANDDRTEVEHEQDDDSEPVLGPLLADLSAAHLAGDLQQLVQGAVPTGTFHELKIAIGPISADKAGTDAGLADMAAQHASLIIDGTIDGKAFSFVSSLTAEVDVENEIVVSAGKSNNVTLSIDPGSWFGGTGTARLDPNDAASRSAIENNIEQSIRGFEDDDHSGMDDHGGTGGSDDGSGHH